MQYNKMLIILYLHDLVARYIDNSYPRMSFRRSSVCLRSLWCAYDSFITCSSTVWCGVNFWTTSSKRIIYPSRESRPDQKTRRATDHYAYVIV